VSCLASPPRDGSRSGAGGGGALNGAAGSRGDEGASGSELTLHPGVVNARRFHQDARPMKILVWATTFGADLWSMTRWLAARGRDEGVEVRVVMEDPALFRREGVATLFPLDVPIIRRRPIHDVIGVPGWRPDITLLDNRVPLRASSKKGFVLWHGFGWKGPNDRKEFRVLHGQLRRAFGEPLAPSPDLRWSCFGPWDLLHRTEVSGFHPQNCRIVGAASHDDLREPFDRARAQPYYPFDVVRRKTVLIAPTWHYGEVFGHWGTDHDLFERLLARLGSRGVNVILRLHDSFRFERPYRAFLAELARRHPHVLLKYKDKNPDNFLDMQVADLLITNYSSIANLFYATGRPTLHVYPVKDADEAFTWRTYTLLGVKKTEVANARFVWKLPPEDHGGLLARDFTTLERDLERALDEPDCCRDATRAFLDRHMLGADGRNRARVMAALRELANA